MLVVFAGGMVASGLLGEPILGPLKNTPQLLVATICWYIVFYTPFDIGYKVSKFLPVKLVASAMKEIYRAKKVSFGEKGWGNGVYGVIKNENQLKVEVFSWEFDKICFRKLLRKILWVSWTFY